MLRRLLGLACALPRVGSIRSPPGMSTLTATVRTCQVRSASIFGLSATIFKKDCSLAPKSPILWAMAYQKTMNPCPQCGRQKHAAAHVCHRCRQTIDPYYACRSATCPQCGRKMRKGRALCWRCAETAARKGHGKPGAARRLAFVMLRVQGLSYAEIAFREGISRQRAQQLCAPPAETVALIKARAGGCCEMCRKVTARGNTHHVHVRGCDPAVYHDPANLLYCCIGCHRAAHVGEASWPRHQ